MDPVSAMVHALEVRRGSAWRRVSESTDAVQIACEVNALRRGQRRRVAVRVLVDGVQARYWPAQAR